MSQDLGNIAAFVRNLISETFRIVKLDDIGQKDRYRVDIYKGAVTGQLPPEKLKKRQLFGKYKTEVYSKYKSQTQSEIDEIGIEAPLDSRGNVLKSPLLLVGFPLSMATAIMGIIYLVGFFNSEPVEAKPTPQPVQQFRPLQPQPKPALIVKVKEPERPKVKYSLEWRLIGTIINSQGEGLAIIRSRAGQRNIDIVNCQEPQLNEYICEYEGEIVADFTGRALRSTEAIEEGATGTFKAL